MQIYVATKFSGMARAHHFMRMLEAHGHTITHDWTTLEHHNRPRVQCAADDLRGVKEADALVLLQVDAMRGAWIETGAALVLGKPVLVLGYDGEPVFLDLPQVVHARDSKHLMECLEELAEVMER